MLDVLCAHVGQRCCVALDMLHLLYAHKDLHSVDTWCMQSQMCNCIREVVASVNWTIHLLTIENQHDKGAQSMIIEATFAFSPTEKFSIAGRVFTSLTLRILV